ncbi:MAG TPA: hydrogenase maturation nickel metallochaperone HypA [Kiloniellales bacterium]
MHELSIAQSLVELVSDHAAREGADRVRTVHVRLGELSGFRRALYFCFDRVAKGTICEHARLAIEDVPLTVRCDHCDEVKRPGARYNFRCPTCGMPTPKVVTGREMQVTAIELDFDAPRTSQAVKRRNGSATLAKVG